MAITNKARAKKESRELRKEAKKEGWRLPHGYEVVIRKKRKKPKKSKSKTKKKPKK